jgi:DNA-3-methyladenine glycosylase I
MNRCAWGASDPVMMAYHDREWGVPLHDDRALFELLILEGTQAGLSWQTILNKREAFRKAFDRFQPERVAKYGEAKVAELLANAGIVRNRLKVNAAITNAQAYLAVRKESGNFDAYIWGLVGGRPKVNGWRAMKEIPAKTAEAEAMSKDLLKRGFRFVGPTICYAFMQSAGLVNDHTVDCFRYKQLGGKA